MSDWDFLWGLEGQELIDAQSTGGDYWDWDYVAKQEKEEAAKRASQQQSQERRAKKHK